MGCRNTSEIRSNNSAAWNNSYYVDDVGSCCSVGLSNSCDGDDGDSGCFLGQTGVGPWKEAAAGRRPPPVLDSHCVE